MLSYFKPLSDSHFKGVIVSIVRKRATVCVNICAWETIWVSHYYLHSVSLKFASKAQFMHNLVNLLCIVFLYVDGKQQELEFESSEEQHEKKESHISNDFPCFRIYPFISLGEIQSCLPKQKTVSTLFF